MDKRVLVIGASGMVGSALMGELGNRPGIDVVGTFYSNSGNGLISLEMQNLHSINTVVRKVMPNDIYIASYISNVDACETDGHTRFVNIEGVRNIAKVAKEINARVVFFSSSYVFDGNKSSAYTIWDLPFPIQQYGIQKLMSEICLINSSDRNVIVRTVGVFGKEDKRKNFAYQIIDGLTQGKKLFVSKTHRINPIHSEKLACHTANLVEDGLSGLVHVAGSEEMSKYDFALDIAAKFQLDATNLVGVGTSTVPGKAARPLNGCLTGGVSSDYETSMELFYAQE